jgi:hypothetical protein
MWRLPNFRAGIVGVALAHHRVVDGQVYRQAVARRGVMVTRAVDELPQDHRVMRALVRESRHNAGVYASVIEVGEVAEGDAVESVP